MNHNKDKDTTDGKRDEIDGIFDAAREYKRSIGADFHDRLAETIYSNAGRIASAAVSREGEKRRYNWDVLLDRIVTSRIWGFPMMLGLFSLVFWITITGANVPSSVLSDILIGKIHSWLLIAAGNIGLPGWLSGFMIDGVYLTAAWVVSVMLPPMAIFFPLFTLLEDLGYLPRVAFNLDRIFKMAGAHGKQSLSMMMGFGCNAAGVVSTRIIDSPRERLIAIITNNFSLCNGRWPGQILLATIFIGALAPAHLGGVISAAAVVGVALLGVLFSLVVSWMLNKTVLRGEVSTYSLELPPYRPPNVLRILYTSFIDRTLIVLWRAVVFAVPAGGVIWLISNIRIGDSSIAAHLIEVLHPFGSAVGLSGIIIVAFIVAIPANEIVIPTVLMLTVLVTRQSGVGEGAGVLFELESNTATLDILKSGGWTLLIAVNFMLFSLVHNPCSTTIYTIYKETRSVKWTTVATVLPVVMGLILTTVVALVWRALGG